MKTICSALLAVVISSACGGPDTPARPGFTDTRSISQDFSGQWEGSATLYVDSSPAGSRTVDVEVQVEVDGPGLKAAISPVCGDAPFAMDAKGNGSATMWYGSVSCHVATDACQALVIHYTTAVLKVLDDGRFYALLNGVASGCGATSDARVEVYATKKNSTGG